MPNLDLISIQELRDIDKTFRLQHEDHSAFILQRVQQQHPNLTAQCDRASPPWRCVTLPIVPYSTRISAISVADFVTNHLLPHELATTLSITHDRVEACVHVSFNVLVENE
jgi:hypothetical protein